MIYIIVIILKLMFINLKIIYVDFASMFFDDILIVEDLSG